MEELQLYYLPISGFLWLHLWKTLDLPTTAGAASGPRSFIHLFIFHADTHVTIYM